ncbi:YMGG-like glycine zipper-containing protein [Humitalea sp. 24SJ18S-53]|uniref:YMGG-like glycine zipper-containing protein n=1 Tax=Humitalea sp. 24SJ18S-53 TaxID=3422307 RepID=UPI003D665D4E
MRRPRCAAALFALLTLGACTDMSDTGRRTATGALGGAALGGIAGSFSGNAGWGALIGAGVGAGAGLLYDRSQQPPSYGSGGTYRGNEPAY